MKTFVKDGKTIQYQVIVKKNKHTYLRVKDGYVEISTNRLMKRFSEHYIAQQFDKLYEKLQRQNHQTDDSTITLWGKTYELEFSTGLFNYTKHRDSISLQASDRTTGIKKIYLSEMKEMMITIHPQVLTIIKNNGLYALPVKYKYLKSKFGSYHRRHDEITLNTFLAQLDPIYLTYVLYHEYAHKLVFNHSKDFYDILDTWMPGHKNIQKRLKKMVIT